MVEHLLRNELFSVKPYIYLLGFIWFIPLTGFFTSGTPIQHILLVIVLAYWVPGYAAYYEQPALINSLPVTRKKIVTAKYLSALLWFIPAALLVTTYVFLFVNFAPFPARLMTGWDLLLALGVLYLVVSVYLPLLFLFGYIIGSILTALAAITTMIGGQIMINIYHSNITYLDSLVETIMENQNAFILLFAGISLIITLISFAFSVRLYEEKDF